MGVLAAIGRTPLIQLTRLQNHGRVLKVYVKLESLNPGGSSKDRPARAILAEGLLTGAIRADTVVIESSSGNMGIGLAQACRYHRLRFVCVVDPKAAALNVQIMTAYGAQIDLVTRPDPKSGEGLQARIDRVQDLLAVTPRSFWPNQYANPLNAKAHYQTTMQEIVDDLVDPVDFLFTAASTCGTLRGCGEHVRDHGAATRIVAVDAVGSLIFSDQRGPRLIPGLGAGIRPPLCDPALIDRVVHVTDLECVRGCRRLVQDEAIFAGGSSGGVMAAIDKIAGDIPAGATCVAILSDRGERYLDTIYDDAWVRLHFGSPDFEFLAQHETAWTTAVCN